MNHSQKDSSVIFLNFGISPQFFAIILKFYHKVHVIPSKNADRNANSFNPDHSFLLTPALLAQKNYKVAAGCGSCDKLSDL